MTATANNLNIQPIIVVYTGQIMDPTLPNEKIHGTRAVSPPKPDVEPIEIIDHVAERKLVRKLDLHIVPIVMLLYLFSFLDRQVFWNLWDPAVTNLIDR